ncbi:hypothetical protein [Pseudomonas sp. B33.4]|uniref:hypothetical protein n=1 Tax=Pseudomonas sp. B33.4 TaxID=3104265 RepID=UPI002ADEF148|nr:hypothetical protein [Pseudomonas sp. B33.4]
MLDLFDRDERVGMISGTLHCALADDHDFSVGKAIQFFVFGLIRSEENEGNEAKFSYLTRAFLGETSND